MEPKGNQEEQDWIEAFRNGDHKALSYFFKMYYKSLGYFATRLVQDTAEAENIVANCFVKLWEKHQNFQTADNIKSFLFISCRNACLNFLRNLKRKNTAQKMYFNQLERSEENILNEIIEAEFLQILYKEINLLPEKCRNVFKLIYFDGKKTDEIAHELNMTVQNVRNHKSRAIELLKTALLKKGVSSSFILAFLLFIDCY